MPKFTLLSAKLQNFLSVNQADLKFPEYGLVYVAGDAGAGKTTLGNALAKALFGIHRPPYTRASQYSTTTKGDTLVDVIGYINEQDFHVQNGYKVKEFCATTEGLRWSESGSPWQHRPDLDSCRQSLTDILGISKMEAAWCIFCDGEAMDFGKVPDREATNFLMSLFESPPFALWRNNSKAKLDAQKDVITKMQATIHACKMLIVDSQRKLTELNYNEQLENSYQCDLEDILIEQDATQRGLDEVNLKLGGVTKPDTTARDAAKLAFDTQDKAKLNEAKQELAQVDKTAVNDAKLKLQAANNEKALAAQAVKARQRELANIESQLQAGRANHTKILASIKNAKTECPTCGLNFVGAVLERAESAKQRLQAEADDVLAKNEALEVQLAEFINDTAKEHGTDAATNFLVVDAELAYAAALEDYKIAVRAAEQKVKDVEAELEVERTKLYDIWQREETKLAQHDSVKLTAELQAAKSKLLIEAKLLKDKESNLRKLIRTQQDNKQKHINLTEVIATQQANEACVVDELAQEEFLLSVIQYWHNATGPSGLANMLLEEVIPALNAHSAAICAELTDSQFNIVWSATRSKANGEDAAELTWELLDANGKKLNAGTSKGESSLIRFIISATLASCGNTTNKCNWRWYDEVTVSMPPFWRKATYNWIKRQAHEHKLIIFLVDHHPEAITYADHILRVTHTTETGTQYAWAQ